MRGDQIVMSVRFFWHDRLEKNGLELDRVDRVVLRVPGLGGLPELVAALQASRLIAADAFPSEGTSLAFVHAEAAHREVWKRGVEGHSNRLVVFMSRQPAGLLGQVGSEQVHYLTGPVHNVVKWMKDAATRVAFEASCQAGSPKWHLLYESPPLDDVVAAYLWEFAKEQDPSLGDDGMVEPVLQRASGLYRDLAPRWPGLDLIDAGRRPSRLQLRKLLERVLDDRRISEADP
jgi:hypothetical protein